MKSKILNSLLIVTSLFGYLEWSGNSSSFLFQAEAEILTKLFTNPTSVLHPFTIIPMVGQILLVVTILQKKPSRTITYLSIGSLGLLLAFMFFIGLLSLNYRIILSTIPFLVVSFIAVRHYRKLK